MKTKEGKIPASGFFTKHVVCILLYSVLADYRCECYDLHNELVPYSDAWSWQKSIVKERKALIELNQDYSDTLIFLQHHPVYTLGTRSSEEFLNFDVKNAPFDVCRTERGGEVTYHGPGQVIFGQLCLGTCPTFG